MVQLAVYNAFLIYETSASGLPKSWYEFSRSHGNIFVQFFFRWKKTSRQRKKNLLERELLPQLIKTNKRFKKFYIETIRLFLFY